MGHWVENSGWQLLGVTSAFWSTPTRTKWTSGVNDTDLKPNGVQISQPAPIKRAKTSMIIRERLYCLAERERERAVLVVGDKTTLWFTIFSCLERSSGRGGGVGGNFSNPLLPLCFIEFNSAWNSRRFAPKMRRRRPRSLLPLFRTCLRGIRWWHWGAVLGSLRTAWWWCCSSRCPRSTKCRTSLQMVREETFYSGSHANSANL